MTDALPDRGGTIFAPASGFGRAAVAVVRISGPAAGPVLDLLASGRPEPRRLALRRLRDPDTRALLDQALVAWLPGPTTATGEDMAELHLHGGLAVRAAVLRALASVPGCRPAEAGAFSRRAFLNGRIDLTEAEGIADLIDAETEAQRVQALRQLEGALGRQVTAWRETGIDLLANAEAALDFADEGDVDADELDAALSGRAAALRDAIQGALADGRRGERLREGFCVVLAGAPNAGKSTLLNALSGRDAAIVSDIPGTTRDAIEVRCDLGGLPVILVDTAGLRATEDVIEAEGVRRTHRRIRSADLVLHLVPADAPAVADGLGDIPTLRVRTKSDLAPEAGGGRDLAVSAVNGAGLDTLLDAVQAAAFASLGQGDALVTRERHRAALTRAAGHLDRVCTAPAGFPPELVAEDLRLAVRALGEVGGHVGVEEMLDRLFSGFCIGK
ncbi:MAG TPA: tRNA uridine-5-carboxymethylaminomethyl(34) synthesis GTPase MnmE [Methylobacterium sp.]|jgi:tRNA modification GTPase|uniref:tRNA uridine-5-carboxymethylaminomethyl(34) synthesis GTPase MnmE n=1 Tax=Methylorubrum sp. B1-46 TaxID=2897334 RepID=UPI001E41A00E|nr:tRNA uridine-5-carboxymethylaminomethyl(34) synthesis GTPase MnmE [Methylorubrum sp. B1-46]UGB27683.1 tRNA uridine-5-carboxymethylaminomethyl(34) synthesis GTPase MnmE [Methylorubrum sp. B1-46]HEV2542664.1 tRNA uridine-5-carboxymethylaminomethyl(34) synthesis GTPase MnmE [Methylobacterium sp.]